MKMFVELLKGFPNFTFYFIFLKLFAMNILNSCSRVHLLLALTLNLLAKTQSKADYKSI